MGDSHVSLTRVAATPGGTTLVVNEIFGPTLQGEGPSAGRLCGFLRLGGCNLSCRWCDTPYTWDWRGVSETGHRYRAAEELHPMSTATVLRRLFELDVDLVVVSGGEPLSQQGRLLGVVTALLARGVEVEIETNGTVCPAPELVATGARFNVSPKLAHSGDPEHRRIVPAALESFAAIPGSIFKFVCRSNADLEEVAVLAQRHKLRRIWIMPLARGSAQVLAGLRELAPGVIARRWNMTSRMHVLLWEEQRGV